MSSETTEEKILSQYRHIAMVGASPNSERPSYVVNAYLTDNGYQVIPVNPGVDKILGKTSYPDLSSIPEKVEVVDIFRKSEDVPPIIEEAIKIGARAVWMQEGVINEEAGRRAKDAGLMVVMNQCMRKEHLRIHEKS
ncbi:CoA-binding protein [Chloroflexota bacterium]